MHAYKTPSANLNTPHPVPFKPVKAIVIGMLYTIVLMLFVSSILLVAFIFVLGLNNADPTVYETVIPKSTSYLITDILFSFAILYLAGRMACKHTPNQEIKYGFILSVLTLIIYIPFSYSGDTISHYPLWYILVSLANVFIAIYLGAKSRLSTRLRQ